MGKIKKLVQLKLDLNHDGVVNMKDLKLAMMIYFDKNSDLHVSSQEVLNEIGKIVVALEEIKKM